MLPSEDESSTDQISLEILPFLKKTNWSYLFSISQDSVLPFAFQTQPGKYKSIRMESHWQEFAVMFDCFFLFNVGDPSRSPFDANLWLIYCSYIFETTCILKVGKISSNRPWLNVKMKLKWNLIQIQHASIWFISFLCAGECLRQVSPLYSIRTFWTNWSLEFAFVTHI